jgi:hypothetical protein
VRGWQAQCCQRSNVVKCGTYVYMLALAHVHVSASWTMPLLSQILFKL